MQQSHQNVVIQLNNFNEIMKLLEKSQEKQPIEDEAINHQFGQSPDRPLEE